MAILTPITGYLYTARGMIVTEGRLTFRLQSTMVSLDGYRIVPFTESFTLSPDNGGLIDVSLMPTQGASPSGLCYLVEFDPYPMDRSRPVYAKDGYWRNYWSVPDTRVNGQSVPYPLGQFLRNTTTF